MTSQQNQVTIFTDVPPMKGAKHYPEIPFALSEQLTKINVNGKWSNIKLGFIGQFGSFSVPAQIGVL